MEEKTVFSFVKSINEHQYNFEKEFDKSIYNTYVITQAFSYFPDTIFLANEMNLYPGISNEMHYDFLFYTIPKKKRFSQWFKLKKHNQATFLSEWFNVRYDKAVEIMNALGEEKVSKLIDEIQKQTSSKK